MESGGTPVRTVDSWRVPELRERESVSSMTQSTRDEAPRLGMCKTRPANDLVRTYSITCVSLPCAYFRNTCASCGRARKVDLPDVNEVTVSSSL